jgi:hypothetical protein
MKRFILHGILLVWLAACAPQPGPSSNRETGQLIPPLTEDEVMDAQVALTTLTANVPITYQLTDGVYQKGTDPAGASFVSIRLLDPMAFGDLNADGAGDAAALVAENYGGTGTFVSLAAFGNEKGMPVQKAITPIDDRPIIQSVSIEAGEIGLEATIHGFEDPMCCPTLQTQRHYRLYESQLILRDFSTQSASGQWRTITITSPQDGEVQGASVDISGTVTIAPFENNLSYYVVDAAGNELAAGPAAVAAQELGAPGTFVVSVPLEHVPPGTTAWIELRDTSAADGSLLAMDSVEVTRE